MWIARMENGETYTQKDYDFNYLDHSKINSLQLFFNGKFFTVTRGNKSQALILDNRSSSDLHYLTGKVTTKHIAQRIYCVKDNISKCVGWEINYEWGIIRYLEFIGIEPINAFYHFNFDLVNIVDNNKTKVFVSELDVRKKKANEWTCISCAVINTDKDTHCHYCGAPRRERVSED